MHNNLIIDHMANPRNVGVLPGATGRSIETDSIAGNALRIAVRIEGDEMADMRFACFGDPVLRGIASYVTDALKGRNLLAIPRLTVERIAQTLGLTAEQLPLVRMVILTVLKAVQNHHRRSRVRAEVQ
jgi:nitrogen fixation protein NifU and related proteins